MMQMMMKFHARRDWPFGDGIQIFAHGGSVHDERRAIFLPTVVEYKTVDKIAIPTEPEPWLQLDVESAQRLMDELWNVGLRPSEGTGSAGSLAATQKHLNDVRAIVAKTLDVKLP